MLNIGFPDSLKTPADLIIANILLTPLMQLKSRFRELMKPSGTLVVSGILETQVAELIKTYQDDFTHTQSLIQDGWALLIFSRNHTLR